MAQLFPLFVFIAGLLLGSLLNVLIIRIPRERGLLGWPHCTRTGAPLRLWQLTPLVGWLVQRGRAADGRRLHWVFPVVELLTAVVVTALYLRYGFSDAFAYVVFVCSVLIVTGAIDLLHRFIYTFVILGAAVLALIFGPLVGLSLPGVLLGALGGGVGFALLYALAKVLYPGKAAPFGLGDVYLAIFIGAAVGLANLFPALFIGMLMAGIVAAGIVVGRAIGRSNTPEYISYGTYLCLGTVIFIALGGLG
jgi:leader peptidase (prepilin peptidase)/N-methyltransferase